MRLKKKVNRLPVLVSGLEFEQLFDVPKLESGSGRNEANGIIQLINEWNIKYHIKAMCFNTARVNTGIIFNQF